MSSIVIDIEADGLLDTATRAWCMCAVDHTGKEWEAVGEAQIRQLVNQANTYDAQVGHNIIGYDNALIGNLYGLGFTNPTDTLLLSQLLDPDRVGGHGLEAWGERLGVKKPAHEDWSRFSEEMLHRCKEDVRINLRLYKLLLSELSDWDWEAAIKLEHDVAKWHSIQVRNGVMFDNHKAIELCNTLRGVIEGIDEELSHTLPYVLHKGSTVNQVFKTNGGAYGYVDSYWGWEVGQVAGAYSKVAFEKVDASSQSQIKDYFLSLGWKPTEFTEKGSPKLSEDSFSSLPQGTPAAKLGTRRVAQHRLSQVEGLLKAVRLDGRIESDAATCGSVTGRYRHRVVANLPRVTSPYGLEMRALFRVPEGKVQIGSDMSQIEGRIMAHYLYPYDGGLSAKELLESDIHQKLADHAKCTRDEAKTIRYAIMYGCAASNLGAKVGVSVKRGKELYKHFWDANPTLAKLRDDVSKAFKRRGFIKGLDGRKIMIRSDHSALNALFQSAATVAFKQGLCYINETLTEMGISYKQLIAYHDEVQIELDKEDVDVVSSVVLDSWKRAGEKWGIKVPIVGEVKVGSNWADCH